MKEILLYILDLGFWGFLWRMYVFVGLLIWFIRLTKAINKILESK